MWDRIEPLMPADPVHGRRWADHRRTLEAIAWKYRTDSPWRGLPDELGLFQTAHKRVINGPPTGTWQRILAAVLAAADVDGDIGWTASVDSTVISAHQRDPHLDTTLTKRKNLAAWREADRAQPEHCPTLRSRWWLAHHGGSHTSWKSPRYPQAEGDCTGRSVGRLRRAPRACSKRAALSLIRSALSVQDRGNWYV